MFPKTLLSAITAGFLILSASLSAEEKLTLESSSNAFINWLEESDTSLEIGNFTSGGRAKDNDYAIFNRIKGDTPFYSNTYIEAFFKSADWHGFQLGLGLYGHLKTFNLHETYEEKIDDDYHIYLSDVNLTYNFNDKAFAKVGRFNSRQIAMRFDPENAEGAYFEYEDKAENFRFQLGVIRQFAFFFNDYVVDYYEVERAVNLSDKDAQAQVGDLIYFTELKFNACDNLSFNPYFYFQEEYLAVYGLDTELSFKTSNNNKYGSRLYMYYANSQINSTDAALEENSFNYSFAPFAYFGNWQIEIGFAQFGDNSEANRPAWGYRYLTNVLYDNDGAVELVDYNGAYGTRKTDVYFGRLAYLRDKWNVYFSGGYFDVGDKTYQDQNVWELQVGGSCNPCENFTVGSRLVSIISNERFSTGIERDVNYFELWMAYKFK